MIKSRSPQFVLKARKYIIPILKKLFGCEVRGFEKLKPNEKYLLVGNHNVGVLIEGLALLEAWEERFQGKPVCYALAHRFFFSFPGVNMVMKKLGCIPASFEKAREAFTEGSSVLVFPGGNYEAMRLYSEREVCDFNQRQGWVKVALQNRVPIVPVSIVGSHSVNPIFVRSRLLSYILVLPILFRIKWFPISLSQIVYSLLAFMITSLFLPAWGVGLTTYFVYLFSFFAPIVPTKIRCYAADPVDLMSFNAENKTLEQLMNDSAFIQRCYDAISNQVQRNMDLMNQK